MPWLGLGVYRAEEGPEVEEAVRVALELGYRAVDTASMYRNESGVGRALHASGLPREEVFLTTKVWNSEQGYDSTLRAFEASLKRLGVDYVDLYLIHWPVPGRYKETWRALERLYREGRARAIGVSNFQIHHLEDLLAGAEVAPMVNQVECHPRLQQRELLDFCRAHAIQLEAWAPLMRGRLSDEPTLRRIAAARGKTPAQVMLRWNLQRGVVVIPKSVRRERIEENAGIFDFELSEQEMEALASLERGERIGPDPDHVDF
ncbi:MAG: aldo/keto reductase [Firmicutes bacterium]|nr:aldo/keto reductase [Bacillota bacterium]